MELTQILVLGGLILGLFLFLALGSYLNSKTPMPEGCTIIGCESCTHSGCHLASQNKSTDEIVKEIKLEVQNTREKVEEL